MINKMIEKWKKLKTWQKVLVVLLIILFLAPAADDEIVDGSKEENNTVEQVEIEETQDEKSNNNSLVEKEEAKEEKEVEKDNEDIIDDRPKTIIAEINDAMEKNEMKAQKTYCGKRYLITAEIENISTTFIKGNPKLKMRQGNILFDVTFSNDNIAFYNMEKGDTITFTASFDGWGIEGDFVKAKLTQETVDKFK